VDFLTSESKLGYEGNFNEETHFCEHFKSTSNPHQDCGSFVVVVRIGGKCRKCHPRAHKQMQCRNPKQFKLFCRVLDEVGHYNEWGYDCE
jgi:hypothetical protein